VDRSPLSRLSTRDKRAPRTRSLVVIPRQLVKAASAPLELDPPSTRTFPCHATNEPEMRLADFCNPHVKDEHPLNRVASGFAVEGAPDLTGGRCLHAATARFGQNSAASTGVLFPLRLATEPGPLMPPSPPRTERDVSPLDSFRPRPLPPPPNVMSFGFFDPRHLPSIMEPFSGPSPILDSAFRRAPDHDHCFAFGGS